MGSVRVLAEYVTLKVEDPTAGVHFVGYLKDSIVQNVEAESLKHHLDLGMVEKVKAAKPDQPPADQPPADPPASPPSTEVDQPPAGNASREDWATYAMSMGAPESETKPVEEGGLRQTDLRAKYGA